MHNFKELNVWQKSIQVAIDVYKFSQILPTKDQYLFSSQITRCSYSIPSNIAEGAGKDSSKDFNRYLSIAVGSSFELETQMIIIKEVHQNLTEVINPMLVQITDIQKMLFGLKKTISKKS